MVFYIFLLIKIGYLMSQGYFVLAVAYFMRDMCLHRFTMLVNIHWFLGKQKRGSASVIYKKL